MKPIMQKIVSFLAILFTSFAAHAYDFEVDGMRYSIISSSDLTVELVGLSTEWNDSIVNIPPSVKFKDRTLTVTSVASYMSVPRKIIKKITFPSTVKYIGNMFNQCPNLKEIYIPEGVESIGEYAFMDCSSLSEITIPRSINYLGGGAFHNCANLIRINITDIKAWLSIENEGASLFRDDAEVYIENEIIHDLIIPDGVEKISNNAFKGWANLKSISIPPSVTYIGKEVFTGCKGLEIMRFEDADTPIYFENKHTYGWSTNNILITCKKLSSLYLGRNLEYSQVVGEKTPFEGSYIQNVTIGNHVTYIPPRCFIGASVSKVNIPSSVVAIHDGAFQSCPLQELYIEDGYTALNVGSKFQDPHVSMFDKSSIRYLYLGRELNGRRFPCNKLEIVEIGKNIDQVTTSISRSDVLDTIKIHNVYPPEYSDNRFSDKQYAKVVLCVPMGALTEYQNHPIWRNFWTVNDCLPVPPPDILASAIILAPSSIKETIDNKIQISATIIPDDTSNKTIEWSSSDESVAKVDNAGLISLIKSGTATITAKCGEVSATCLVTVVESTVPAESISLNKSEAKVDIKETLQLTATVKPDEATDKTVAWNSSDEAVATVSETGLVTAKAVGIATITAKCGELTATCAITVEDSSAIDEVFTDPDERVDVYSILGIRMREGVRRDDITGLPAGVYILRTTSGKTMKVVII